MSQQNRSLLRTEIVPGLFLQAQPLAQCQDPLSRDLSGGNEWIHGWRCPRERYMAGLGSGEELAVEGSSGFQILTVTSTVCSAAEGKPLPWVKKPLFPFLSLQTLHRSGDDQGPYRLDFGTFFWINKIFFITLLLVTQEMATFTLIYYRIIQMITFTTSPIILESQNMTTAFIPLQPFAFLLHAY